jgi:hypothetical protein
MNTYISLFNVAYNGLQIQEIPSFQYVMEQGKGLILDTSPHYIIDYMVQ